METSCWNHVFPLCTSAASPYHSASESQSSHPSQPRTARWSSFNFFSHRRNNGITTFHQKRGTQPPGPSACWPEVELAW